MEVEFSRRIAQMKLTLRFLLEKDPGLYEEIMKELRKADSLKDLPEKSQKWVKKAEELRGKDYSLIEKEKKECEHPFNQRSKNTQDNKLKWICLQCGFIKKLS